MWTHSARSTITPQGLKSALLWDSWKTLAMLDGTMYVGTGTESHFTSHGSLASVDFP